MRREFRLHDVGEGLTEAEVVRWLVQPGDEVKLNQEVVEVETAKSIVALPISWGGVVLELLAEVGQTVDVGAPLIAVDTPEEEEPGHQEALAEDLVPNPPEEGAVEPGAHGSPAPKEERQAVLVGYGVKTGTTRRRPRKTPAPATIAATPVANPDRTATSGAPGVAERPLAPEPVSTPAPEPVRAPEPVSAPAPDVPARVAVLAKPPVRKLAKDLGVDLTTLTGSGPQGSITREDVHAAAAREETPPVQETVQDEERVPVKGVRKMTAQAMVGSAFTAPHVTEFLQVDVTETMAAVRRLRAMPDFAEVKVSPLLLVAKAVLVAAGRHPMINSAWDEASQEIVVKRYVNLGIAAATPRGLLVPNIKNAHRLPLPDLARALNELAETARAGRTQPAEMAGGTITITNVGVFGVDTGTPILNPGESAILAFGQVRDMPWVVDGELAVRKVTTLAVSFDHRVVDGELGSMFLRDVGAMLEDPLRMIAWS
ncbi:2-oxo acid dehydrogenase subunit E2 [Nonomuraea sp. NPDC048826]|uniref:dihydrolipoamide acetyltransferase family protein n=1 Tax=Nonomuraea sp. NPDC048826 TaxID=3364347 RepID=UPI00371FCBBF